MHGLAVYVKEGLPFAQDISLENSADCNLGFQLALFHFFLLLIVQIPHSIKRGAIFHKGLQWKSFARNEGKAGIGSWFCNTGMGKSL